MVGCGVGDALGMPYETLGEVVHKGLATWDGSFQPGNWHKLPAGHWTDDTEMAECLATSLIENNGFNGEDVARRYLAWSQATPHGMGGTTHRAMQNLKNGIAWTVSGVEVDDPAAVGAGTAMRCAPIGAFSRLRHQDLLRICQQDAYITHRNIEAITASYVIVLAIRMALVECSGSTIMSHVVSQIGPGVEGDGFDRTEVFKRLSCVIDNFSKITPEEIVPTIISRRGNAASIVASGLLCACYYDNFKDGVIAAVKMGGDTDTRAAVAGAVLGARFGLEGIPQEYKDGVKDFGGLAALDVALSRL